MAIAHELTKKFESVDRGFLKELLDTYGSKDVKGEFVLIVSGKSSSDEFKDLPIEEHVYQVMSIMNISRQEAIKLVANLRGLSKRKVYQVALKKQNSSFSE